MSHGSGAAMLGLRYGDRGDVMAGIVVRAGWALAVGFALWLLWRGLEAGVYFEPTGEALAEARHGALLVGLACLLLVAAAAFGVLVARQPLWVGIALLSPVLLCGGLTWLASETLFPILAVLVAYPAALAGLVGGGLLKGSS
jgi:hypothetical protein